MDSCKIKRVHNDFNTNPVLGKLKFKFFLFQSLTSIESLVHFQSSLQSTDNFQTKFYGDRQKKRLLAVHGDECVYNGYVESPKVNLCDTLIAVRKKGSKKVT